MINVGCGSSCWESDVAVVRAVVVVWLCALWQVDSTDSMQFIYSPPRFQVDYACQFGCAPAQKKSAWTPAESTWNMWGKVKSSTWW